MKKRHGDFKALNSLEVSGKKKKQHEKKKAQKETAWYQQEAVKLH